MSDDFKHVYDWLEEPAADEGERLAKEWLEAFCKPAYDKLKDGSEKWLEARILTCEWKGRRLRCVGASRLGDVWLREEGSKGYYDHRVDVQTLSKWQRKDPTCEQDSE